MRRLAALALLAAAAALAQDADGGPAEASDGGVPESEHRPGPPGPDADLARKDVHAASIHLQVAKLYVGGLYALAGRGTSWDRERGISLFTHAQNAASDAERTVAELSGLAKGEWAKAADPIRKVRAALATVQSQLRSVAVPVRGAGGQGAEGRKVLAGIYKSLDSAKNDLDSAAKVMGVDTKLHTP
jgi:hypothetical protein